MWRLTSELVWWWHAHIGELPTSYHDEANNGYRGDFHQFAVAIMTPVLGARGLDAIIERVVAEFRQDMEQAEKG
jgi:hypothetical protein